MKFRMTKTEKKMVLDRLRDGRGIGQGIFDVLQAPPGVDVEKAIVKVARNLSRRMKAKRVVDTEKLSHVEQLIFGDVVNHMSWVFERLWERAMSGRMPRTKYNALARVAVSLQNKIMDAGMRPRILAKSIRPLEPRRR